MPGLARSDPRSAPGRLSGKAARKSRSPNADHRSPMARVRGVPCEGGRAGAGAARASGAGEGLGISTTDSVDGGIGCVTGCCTSANDGCAGVVSLGSGAGGADAPWPTRRASAAPSIHSSRHSNTKRALAIRDGPASRDGPPAAATKESATLPMPMALPVVSAMAASNWSMPVCPPHAALRWSAAPPSDASARAAAPHPAPDSEKPSRYRRTHRCACGAGSEIRSPGSVPCGSRIRARHRCWRRRSFGRVGSRARRGVGKPLGRRAWRRGFARGLPVIGCVRSGFALPTCAGEPIARIVQRHAYGVGENRQRGAGDERDDRRARQRGVANAGAARLRAQRRRHAAGSAVEPPLQAERSRPTCASTPGREGIRTRGSRGQGASSA